MTITMDEIEVMGWKSLQFKHMSMDDRLKQVALHKLMEHEIKELGSLGTECKTCGVIWMPEVKNIKGIIHGRV